MENIHLINVCAVVMVRPVLGQFSGVAVCSLLHFKVQKVYISYFPQNISHSVILRKKSTELAACYC